MAKREKGQVAWRFWAVATRLDDGSWYPWKDTMALTPKGAKLVYEHIYNKKFTDAHPNPRKFGVGIRRFEVTEIKPKGGKRGKAK